MVKNRIELFRQYMAEQKLEAALISKEQNVTYLSGFTGDSSKLLITLEGNYFLTDFRYFEQVEEECPEYEIVKWEQGIENDVLNNFLAEKKIACMGFESEELSYSVYKTLEKALQGIVLIPMENAVETLRYQKDAYEISQIEKAAEMADKAFKEILPLIRPGAVEKELADKLLYSMMSMGAQGSSYDILLVSGVKTSLPHGKPDNKKIEQGDFVTIDFGGKFNGYMSDMTRTLVIGQPDDRQKKIYDLVLEAQLKGVSAVKAGITGKQVDDSVREIFKREDLNHLFGHGTGHGVGLEVHENPRLRKNSKHVLKAGCVITVEPGLYIPQWGGVRIEDILLVEEDGCRPLNHVTKELIIL